MKEEVEVFFHLIKSITLWQVLKTLLFLVASCGFVVLVFVVMWWFQKMGWMSVLIDWVQQLGPLGAVLLSAALILINAPFAGGFVPIVIVCGFLFGFGWGMTLVVASCSGELSSFALRPSTKS